MEALANSLMHNTALQELWLGRNSGGDEGAVAFAAALTTNNSLNTLRLDNKFGMAALSQSLAQNDSLLSLEIGGNQLGSVGLSALSGALKRNKTLTFLGLRQNSIDDTHPCGSFFGDQGQSLVPEIAELLFVSASTE
jgi:Leucine Rich repeat